MKKSEPAENDRKLSNVLREWKVGASLPPRFQEGVWRRIESATVAQATNATVWSVFSRWIGSSLSRPAMAVAYIGVLLTIGATVGWARAYQQNARVKDELGQRYVQVLDPFQAPHN
jgi:hypothetical protein